MRRSRRIQITKDSTVAFENGNGKYTGDEVIPSNDPLEYSTNRHNPFDDRDPRSALNSDRDNDRVIRSDDKDSRSDDKDTRSDDKDTRSDDKDTRSGDKDDSFSPHKQNLQLSSADRHNFNKTRPDRLTNKRKRQDIESSDNGNSSSDNDESDNKDNDNKDNDNTNKSDLMKYLFKRRRSVEQFHAKFQRLDETFEEFLHDAIQLM